MKGSIHTDARCQICGGIFKHDENRSGLFCSGQGKPHTEIAHLGKCRVYFGETSLRCPTYQEAEQFLLHLRWKHGKEGSYDPRDYKKENPLGFSNLAGQWLARKEKGIKGKVLKPSSLRNLKNYMRRAKTHWAQRNIKEVMADEAGIEDFLFDIEGISEKTRANHKSCLHDFFRWISRREKITMPEMPDVPFELEYRKPTDFETQGKISDEVRKISYHINPKIHFGIELLTTYADLRPSDLLKLAEGDIDTEYGILTIYFPTKKKNKTKTVRLVAEHAEKFKALKKKFPALPHMPFYRHMAGISGVRADTPFGSKYFYKWWIKACKNLGIKDLDLYAGTRHTTVTETSKLLGRQAGKIALGNTTNKAIERYLQHPDDDERLQIVTLVRQKTGRKVVNIKEVKR